MKYFEKAKYFLILMRPYQWVKNLFLFTPFFFSFQWSLENFIKSLIGFILFTLVSSAVYIFNDIKDIKEDREHPTKKDRPLASGKVSKIEAFLLILFLAIPSIFISITFFRRFSFMLFLYIFLNVLYTMKIKHLSPLDIILIACNFIVRVIAGAIMIDVKVSMWIILVTFSLALFLSLAKRRDDILLSLNGIKVRKSISGYSLEMVNSAMTLMGGVTIVSYIMYTTSETVQQKLNTDKLYLTAFFVIVGILRYFQITFVNQMSGDPSRVLLKDRFLQGVILLWLLSFYLVVKI